MLRSLLCTAAILAAAPALAQEKSAFSHLSDGQFLVRARALTVMPQEDVSVDGVPTASAGIDDSLVPELDLTYFFTPNIAAELILGVTPHNVGGQGAIAGADIGSVWLLPPTLTVQYHFNQLGEWTQSRSLAHVKPYVGAGVNYTVFFNEDAGQFNSIDYDNAFGVALQAGVDVELSEGIYFNADVKYIFLETDYSINGGAVKGTAEINPLLVGFGLGYRF